MDDQCGRLVNEGVKLYNSAAFHMAYRKFDQAINLCPQDGEALLWRGKAAFMLGELRQAVGDLTKALASAKDSITRADAKLSLALSLYLYSFFSTERERPLKDAFFFGLGAAEDFKKLHANSPIYNYFFLQRLSALVEVLSFLESDELREEVKIGVGGDIASISSVLYEKANENLFEKYYKKYIDKDREEYVRRRLTFGVGQTGDPGLSYMPRASFSEYEDLLHDLARAYIDLFGSLPYVFRRAELESHVANLQNRVGNLGNDLAAVAPKLELPLIIFLKDFVYLSKGRILLELAKYNAGGVDEALAELDRVSRVAPLRLLALFFKGQAYETKGQVDEACRQYSEALKGNSDLPRVRLRMRLLGCRPAQVQGGTTCDEVVAEAERLYNSMMFQEALDMLRAITGQCADEPKALLLRGKAELMLGEIDQALSALKAVVESKGDRGTVAEAMLYTSLAKYVLSYLSPGRDRELGEVLSAAQLAEEGLRQTARPYLAGLGSLLRFLALYGSGKRAEAERLAEEASGKEGEDMPYSLLYLMRAYVTLGKADFEDAIRYVNEALRRLKKDLIRHDLDLPLFVLLKDLMHVAKARVLFEGLAEDEAFAELEKVSGLNAIKLLAARYNPDLGGNKVGR